MRRFEPEQCFGQITTRAFAEINKTLKLTQHLLCDNGHHLLMKGINVESCNLKNGENS
ncbi:MAG: class I SAM-dependent methyltransferase [Candidatus Thiodubiliella endoseptemdiera]|uniref:Class I SAM-dependent methyltransferase n=1 Tax=Candidatus Thiodubiliella endoseptemdiera TaxID=2738886 RepID=A0A853F1F2_9GAMM|nr:class I SAM-dependent methyltransferase [Candidatus Thiodubiliella endoseptemdiera]